MILTAEQREKVEQNIRLVQKVINDKVHGPYQLGIYTYDDIFQIGCIGLCKAATGSAECLLPVLFSLPYLLGQSARCFFLRE